MMDKKIAGHVAYVETIITCTLKFKRQLNSSRYRSMEYFCPTSYLPRMFTGFKSGDVEAILLIQIPIYVLVTLYSKRLLLIFQNFLAICSKLDRRYLLPQAFYFPWADHERFLTCHLPLY
jgi:hypothetical protein